jgi:hypothetical protein
MYTDATMTTTTWYYFSQQCKDWFDAWNGGAVDDVHQQLILFGGGHDDSENNMVLTLGLNGTPAWTRFKDPTVPVPYPDSQNWEGLKPYFVRAADGGVYAPGASPSSRHTYGELQYVPSQNKLYVFGGAVEHGGMSSVELWTLDMSSGTWTLTSPYGKVPGGLPTTAYNPKTGHVVMHDNNWSLYDFNPATNAYTLLTNNANLSNTFHSAAAIDPVNNYFVILSTGGGSAPAYDYYPGTPGVQVIRGFDLSGADHYATHVWDDSSCSLINAYTGLQFDSALGLLVGYPGGGNQIFFLNAGPNSVTTSYGTVPSHKCLNVTIGSQKGIDYPQDPEVQNGSYFTGINQRFAYFPSLDIFVLANRVTNNANAWVLRLSGGNPQPNLTVAASPNSLTVPQGSPGTSTITTTVSGGFNSAVALSAAGVPTGTTVSFSPTPIAAPGAGSSAMTVNVGSTTPVGSYPITVTASGGGLSPNATVTLTVTAAAQPDFTLAAAPTAVTVAQGNQGSSTITTTVSGGFNAAIGLSSSGVPTGTTVSFNPGTIAAPGAGTSAMTISVGSTTAVGTYPITVTGTGGGKQHTATVTLTVTAAAQPDFTLAAAPVAVTVTQGNQGSSTITTTVNGGFNAAIGLSSSGVPTGTTVSFNPSTIAAPGAGTSAMTISVGSTTAVGTYPLTVTGTGGGKQHTATVTLTVTAAVSGWQAGFLFRATAGYVKDPSNTTHVLATTAYPTTVGGMTFGWANTKLVQSSDRSTMVDARLAGINYARDASPATFNVDVPVAGTYKLSLAMGDDGYGQCWNQCQIQFLDGKTVLATVTGGPTKIGYFYDQLGNNWSAASWPTSNLSGQVTLKGTRLSVVVGSSTNDGYLTPIAFLGLAQAGGGVPNFTLSAAPAAVTVVQGNQGSSTITTTVSGGFNSAIALSASGAPVGTTVKFNPGTIAAPGAGTSAMTISVGSTTAVGTYPITIIGNGGGTQHTATVTLTVTAAAQPDFTLAAAPVAVTVTQGNQGSSTITTTVSGGFNAAIGLSSSGVPTGTTVSFNPSTIAAPGAGTSAMTISVGSTTAVGTYPIIVTGSGGTKQHTATVTLTVTAAAQPDFTLAAAPVAVTVTQGNQGSSTITTTVSGGFNAAIGLSSSGVPTGTTVSFNPSTIAAPGAGTSAMTISVGSTTAVGTYPIIVTGSGGGKQHTATVTLTVITTIGDLGNGISVTDLSGLGQSNRFVSLGRFFRQGDIPHFAQAVLNGTQLLTQCDVKNRWPDGSLKFAIISFILPSVSTKGTDVTFQDQSTGNNTGYLAQSDMLNAAYDFEGTMRLTGTVSPTVSARSMVQSGQFRYWLQGPIVTAVIIEDRDNRSADVDTDGWAGNPLHPIIEAWFYPQSHKVELGFTLENSWASSTGSNSARNQTYSLSITTGNASPVTRLTQPAFTQWAFTRWRRAFWIGPDPAPIQFNFNPQYLVTTGGYPVYDPKYMPPSNAAVSAEYSVYATQTTAAPALLTIPGIDNVNGNGGIVDYAEYLDGGGDSTHGSWIGLYPTWDIYYLLTGDPSIQKMMTDNSDLAGRFPMWFREADHNAGTGHYFDYPGSGSVDPYGHVVSINARQQVPLLLSQWNSSTGNSNNGCTGGAGDDIQAGAPLSYGGWQTLGTSHLPDFGYVPYTLTGKYYYLEQEQMEDAYVAGFYTGCYNLTQSYWRQGYLGLMQWGVRDQAWALRSLAYGAFVSPDDEPEGAYFKDKLLNNIARLEGEHGLTLDITDTKDRTTSYNWGMNVAQESQAANPSPLGAFDVDSAAYSYAQNGYENNVNPATLKAAGSMFQEAFMNVALGMARQFGIANTKAILTWEAKRPFHILLDPSVNHYLIGQYCYPSQYTDGSWVADWGSFQANYLVLPNQWGGVGSTDDVRGFQQMSGVSFMTDITVDGLNGQAVWNWFKANKPNQDEFQTTDPRWSLIPLQ